MAAGKQPWSEWQDLNLRPPRPERGALPGCATLRWLVLGRRYIDAGPKTRKEDGQIERPPKTRRAAARGLLQVAPPKSRHAAQVSPSPRDLARNCPTAGAEHDLRKVGTGFRQKIMLKQKSEKRCRDSISRGSVLEACWIGELTLSPVAQAMRGGGEQHSDWGVAKR